MTDMFELEAIAKLTKDLRSASITLSQREARYLVDTYYTMQNNRIRAANQIRSLSASGEPHSVLDWLFAQSETIEREIVKALHAYSMSHGVGEWSQSILGIGPVLSAGLLAHINMEGCNSPARIWRFAGLDPSVQWMGREEAKRIIKLTKEQNDGKIDCDKAIAVLCAECGRDGVRVQETLLRRAVVDGRKTYSLNDVVDYVIERPWNAKLKVLCWKIGESFIKQKGREKDVYGKLYEQKKMEYHQRNEAGEYKARCVTILATKNFGADTIARGKYSQGLLPDGHIHAMARRWAVKMFLSHWFAQAYQIMHDKAPPLPFAMMMLGHSTIIPVPNSEVGLKKVA